MWDKTRELSDLAFSILRSAARSFGVDRVSRMSAAVAYRAIFALAPLLLIAVFVAGLVVGGNEVARAEILDAIAGLAGEMVKNAVDTVFDALEDTGSTAGVVGFVLLLWTSSSLFLELQNDLDDIFGVPYEQTTGILKTVWKRSLGFLWALSLGLILVLALLLNGVWQFLGALFPDDFEPAHRLISILTPVVSVIVLPFVFALIFQTLTHVSVRWRAIWWGSFFTSVAFLLAAYGTSLYFRLGGDTAAGIAGALFIVLLLTFILSGVFLFGAEVTKVYDQYLRTGDVGSADPGGPEVVVSQPEPAMPLAAVMGFLGGLLVGWRRRS